jgi:hypothetical protein
MAEMLIKTLYLETQEYERDVEQKGKSAFDFEYSM